MKTDKEDIRDLEDDFLKVYGNLPAYEKINHICPDPISDDRMYSWADIKVAIDGKLLMRKILLQKLKKLDLI